MVPEVALWNYATVLVLFKFKRSTSRTAPKDNEANDERQNQGPGLAVEPRSDIANLPTCEKESFQEARCRRFHGFEAYGGLVWHRVSPRTQVRKV
jgi:hypothetical protein